MDTTQLFARGLTDPFLQALKSGPLRPLVDLAISENLELEIREDYINLYDGRGALLKLSNRKTGYKVEIHHKYKPSEAVAPKQTGSYRIKTLKESEVEAWVQDFVAGLAELQKNARDFDKDEGRDEYEICMANRKPAGPVIVIDRQLQLKGTQQSKIDLLAISISDGQPDAVIILELKKESVSLLDLMKGVGQASGYSNLYAPDGKLRADVATSLQTIVQQKASLGVLDDSLVGQDFSDLPVRCLIAVRAKAPSEFAELRMLPDGVNVWYTGIEATTSAIPASHHWHLITETPTAP
jgi:hypothetical protein